MSSEQLRRMARRERELWAIIENRLDEIVALKFELENMRIRAERAERLADEMRAEARGGGEYEQ